MRSAIHMPWPTCCHFIHPTQQLVIAILTFLHHFASHCFSQPIPLIFSLFLWNGISWQHLIHATRTPLLATSSHHNTIAEQPLLTPLSSQLLRPLAGCRLLQVAAGLPSGGQQGARRSGGAHTWCHQEHGGGWLQAQAALNPGSSLCRLLQSHPCNPVVDCFICSCSHLPALLCFPPAPLLPAFLSCCCALPQPMIHNHVTHCHTCLLPMRKGASSSTEL